MNPPPPPNTTVSHPRTLDYQLAVNLPLYLINQRGPKTSVQAYIKSMLAPYLGKDKWSASRAGRFNSREISRCIGWIGGYIKARPGRDNVESHKYLKEMYRKISTTFIQDCYSESFNRAEKDQNV